MAPTVVLPVLLAALVAPVEPGRLEASVGAGAGYDSNLDLASDGSGVASFGTATLSAWGDLGWSAPLGSSTRLYAGGRYDGVLCPEAFDFSRHVPGVDLALVHDVNRWFTVLLSPTAGWAFYGDPARSGPRFNGRLLLRFRVAERISLRLGYGRAQAWASDPVFSVGAHRVLLGAEARLARRTWLAAGYALATGDQVFYRTVSAVAGRGPGHRGTGRFATLEAYQASATEHALSLRLEQGLGSELYLTATYEHTRGSSAQGPYVVNSAFGAAGWRF